MRVFPKWAFRTYLGLDAIAIFKQRDGLIHCQHRRHDGHCNPQPVARSTPLLWADSRMRGAARVIQWRVVPASALDLHDDQRYNVTLVPGWHGKGAHMGPGGEATPFEWPQNLVLTKQVGCQLQSAEI